MASFVLRWAWLIPVAPLLAFAAISPGARRRPAPARTLALAGLVAALLLSQAVVGVTVAGPGIQDALSAAGPEGLQALRLLNPAEVAMLGTVPLICLSIFLFGAARLREEPRARYFYAHLSLVTGVMTAAILARNLLAFCFLWELISAGAYVCTRIWWQGATARRRAIRSFIVGRVADGLLLLALALLYAYAGSLAYGEVFSAGTVARLAATPFLGPVSVATVATLLLLGGVIGKSVERPLHSWRPDVAEGTDTLFALIDTATMVPAGVYLLIRAFPLLAASQAMPVVALTGALVAVSAALVSVVQSDFKRVLALSTISQVGFILAALGVGAYTVALSLLIVHVVIKVLLVMAAASVIDGVERGHVYTPGHAVPLSLIREPFDPTDMLKLGGLAFRLPLASLIFLTGSLALCAVPLVAIVAGPIDGTAGWAALLLLLVPGAALTGLYLARQVALIFLATPRSRAAIYARDSRSMGVLPPAVVAVAALSMAWVVRLAPNAVVPSAESSIGPAWQPVMAATILSVGAWVGGWWLYGRQPLQMRGEDAVDPVGEAAAAFRQTPVIRAAVRTTQSAWGRLCRVAGACSAALGHSVRRMESGRLSDRLTSAFVALLLVVILLLVWRV